MKIFRRILLFTFALVLILSVLCGCERLYSYDKIKKQMLFDHIVYEGTPYYLASESPTGLSEDKNLLIDETVKITIVDKNGIPYDAVRTEDAWVFVNDPDRLYVYYGSAYYTRDTSLASKHYGFED
jgi:hypothetical protein